MSLRQTQAEQPPSYPMDLYVSCSLWCPGSETVAGLQQPVRSLLELGKMIIACTQVQEEGSLSS